MPRRKTRATNQLRLSRKLRDNSIVKDLIINIDDSPEDKGKEVKKKVPAVKQKPRKRVTRSEGLKLLFSAIDSLNRKSEYYKVSKFWSTMVCAFMGAQTSPITSQVSFS